MRNIPHPHTVMVFEHRGALQTLVRKGHLPARAPSGQVSVESVLRAGGVSGSVVIRHHDASMFGKAGRLVAAPVLHEVG